ncbi:MAG: RsmB/NOP family class I SAM-dependent RNA methyltransferase [Bdellovibrionaceae bacterium]|nr:RsmB/NOP family class I SAM-dependent RNA methyltransferase [Pseudobdellovibrionaceae bacterium]
MSDALKSSFNHYYSQIWGERWPELYRALLGPGQLGARWNCFAGSRVLQRVEGARVLPGFVFLQDLRPERAENGLLDFYILDPASVFVAMALQVKPGEKVLDMCAAPGGKTLVLAEALQGQGELIANEISSARRERLMKVIQQYLPREGREFIRVTGKSGEKFGLQQAGEFDSVLVDAPCSGERHLLSDLSEFENWSPRRGEKLSVRQFSLLSSAWHALRPGGRLVYSTCSINPVENDEVVGRLISRRGAKAVEWNLPEKYGGEKTQWGWIFLPDRSGFGPIYFATMSK